MDKNNRFNVLDESSSEDNEIFGPPNENNDNPKKQNDVQNHRGRKIIALSDEEDNDKVMIQIVEANAQDYGDKVEIVDPPRTPETTKKSDNNKNCPSADSEATTPANNKDNTKAKPRAKKQLQVPVKIKKTTK